VDGRLDKNGISVWDHVWKQNTTKPVLNATFITFLKYNSLELEPEINTEFCQWLRSWANSFQCSLPDYYFVTFWYLRPCLLDGSLPGHFPTAVCFFASCVSHQSFMFSLSWNTKLDFRTVFCTCKRTESMQIFELTSISGIRKHFEGRSETCLEISISSRWKSRSCIIMAILIALNHELRLKQGQERLM
jgi:hypothetical protein